jgi:hypothetical protein
MIHVDVEIYILYSLSWSMHALIKLMINREIRDH